MWKLARANLEMVTLVTGRGLVQVTGLVDVTSLMDSVFLCYDHDLRRAMGKSLFLAASFILILPRALLYFRAAKCENNTIYACFLNIISMRDGFLFFSIFPFCLILLIFRRAKRERFAWIQTKNKCI